jgi:hypothetical protein
MEDDSLRAASFASLDVLCATHGEDVPYVGGLDQGFPFGGRRVPFFSSYKGIYRAAAQAGPAALSITTSHASPYDDEEIPDGFLYAFRSGSKTRSSVVTASVKRAYGSIRPGSAVGCSWPTRAAVPSAG